MSDFFNRISERLSSDLDHPSPAVKQSATAIAVVAAAVLTLLVPGLGFSNTSVAVAGIGYAGMQAFPLAMLPDIIDTDRRSTGHDRGGAMSGVWTACETVGLALGPGVFLVILAFGGFVSSSGDTAVGQPDSALIAIALAFSLVPALLVAFSLLFLRGYRDDAWVPAPLLVRLAGEGRRGRPGGDGRLCRPAPRPAGRARQRRRAGPRRRCRRSAAR